MSSRRILVVDDEKNVRFTVTQALLADGYDVDSAANGTEGLKMAGESTYDLLLVDLRMPGMTGIEMLRELRGHDPGMPAVIITAYGVPQQLVEAAELGAIDCIRKPFSILTLRTTVREVLSRANLDGSTELTTAEDYLRRGKRYLMHGELEPARSDLERSIALDPGRPEAHVLVGILSLLESREPEAEESFRTALRFDPTDKNASEYLAWCGS